jgi:two-component system nitrogen regulation sensor histidine kinase NtrY
MTKHYRLQGAINSLYTAMAHMKRQPRKDDPGTNAERRTRVMSHPPAPPRPSPADDRRRRRRELIIIGVLLVVVSLLTMVVYRYIDFGPDIPVSNTILMFSLMNINLLLLLLVLYLVFRNLVKLLFERRRRMLGSKLRTRLVTSFVTLSLLPTAVLFVFSIGFITTSIEFWFNVPVEQALENSLDLGRDLYRHLEKNHRFYADRIGYQIIARKLMAKNRRKELNQYTQVVQRSFNLDAVEIYAPNGQRVAISARGNPNPADIPATPSKQLRQARSPNRVVSATISLAKGDFYRTIASIPIEANPDKAIGFMVLSTLVPSQMAASLASITQGFDEYQQIKLLKQPVQSSYYITLSIVALLVVFGAVWVGFFLAKSISVPIQDLAVGARRVAEGDLEFKVAYTADDEIGSLVKAFNRMTGDLRTTRRQITESSEQLRHQNQAIEEQRRYMEVVLRNVSAGVVSVDAEGRIKTINKAAEKMLSRTAGEVLNKRYTILLKGHYRNLIEDVVNDLDHTPQHAAVLPLGVVIDGEPRSFILHINALRSDTGEAMGMVMLFDDLTELEKAQRMAAWREVARRIAHEVKNPLTPIALSAQRLKRRYSDTIDDPVFAECTRMIIDHVTLIRNLVNEFSAFARFPTANPEPQHLPEIIEETLALYRESHPRIVFSVNVVDPFPIVRVDRQQIKQALINLVDNAITALKGAGEIIFDLSQDPILKMVRLEVADNGPGVSDEDKTRMFEPNFSTKKKGMGLGLTIVNSIVNDHKGMIRVIDNQPRGTKFIIELPA